MKDKTIRAILFGDTAKIERPKCRGLNFTFPKVDNEDGERTIYFRKDDGLILYLIKRIEKLEDRLVNKNKKK
jgi:hypothetical protein